MATSTDEFLPFRVPGARCDADLVSNVLYRLRLNRINVEKDLRVRAAMPESAAQNGLHNAVFEADRLLVSTERLAETKNISEFYVALQDVLANVMGAEHFALFEPSTSSNDWMVTVHCGVEVERALACVGTTAFGATVTTREQVADGCSAAAPELLLPILAGEDVVAVLAIFEWLPQKRFSALSENAEVMEMLRLHTGAILRGFKLYDGQEA